MDRSPKDSEKGGSTPLVGQTEGESQATAETEGPKAEEKNKEPSSLSEESVKGVEERVALDALTSQSAQSRLTAGSAATEAINQLRNFHGLKSMGTGGNSSNNHLPIADYLHPQLIADLCGEAAEVFVREQRVISVSVPCQVFGDLHGNFDDLMTYERLFWKQRLDQAPNNYMFLGDFVDRGAYGVEVICHLFALKVLAPHKFFMVRGNHEDRRIQKNFTFFTECLEKFGKNIGQQLWEQFNRVFDRLPVAAIVGDSVYCAHGGIPASVVSIEDIMVQVPCPLVNPESAPVAWEILWNDPVPDANDEPDDERHTPDAMGPAPVGFRPNTSRGTAFYYTEQGVDKFLETNNLSNIIRAHQMAQNGFKWTMSRKVCTVFSSSHYCGQDNKAACILVGAEQLKVIKIAT